mgnify:CR=1 FL=1
MTKVIGVRFRTAGKIYFFAPGKLQVKQAQEKKSETKRLQMQAENKNES